MKRRAESILPGDRIEGHEVVWVLPVPERAMVVVAADIPFGGGHRGAATEVHRYHVDELVEVEEGPEPFGPG